MILMRSPNTDFPTIEEESVMRQIAKWMPFIIVVALCTASTQSLACGEVLSRTGTAMRYQSFVSRHPADILVYAARSEPGPASRASELFRENLERAGHRVTLVEDEKALAAAFSAHNFDVVIAYSGEVERISQLAANAAREPSLIPVLQRDTPDERAWRERYPRLLTENANLNQFLKSIEQTMKARGV
jgi:hypothetical protein